MKEFVTIACVDNNNSDNIKGVVEMTPEGYDRIWEVTDEMNAPLVNNNRNNGIYGDVTNYMSKIDDILSENRTFSKYSFDRNKEHLELRKLDFVPYSENKIPEVKHYLRKLQRIANLLRNHLANDAGGSKDFEELYNVVTKQLEYFEI